MKFDEAFEFGVSTISYQIEGSPESKTIWDDFCAWDNATVDNKDAKRYANTRYGASRRI